ncbi:PF06532 family protein [Halobacteriovorax sp. BALOs_7]|uniref:DUF1109 family protein n=1 Tax=Halobacteriovorax vibrionivorans TaxID=2152716 RepID=A0ABY0IGS9_9BACT|nr:MULTISPECIES: NrsF family protein [Halobacteriovorax]AYF43580.1 PF06532 family protein [Halobacteriovorax sp. BALOs_7]RZF21852.1 DUF1109 family protein [Halobacteriovorax vibrionivorans]TGD48314.1 DUF1109 family protein [Halobacteriovorax sp. Y22]
MNDNKLINSLVDDLKPIKPLPAPWIRTLVWMGSQIIISVVAIYLSSPIQLKYISNIQFLLQVIVANIALLVGGYLVFANSIPGLLSEKKNLISFIPFLLLFLLLGINYFFPTNFPVEEHHRPHCLLELSILMVIGFAQNYYMLKKGFIAFERSMLTLSFLTSAMIPIIILYFACSFSTEHLLVSHYLPVAVITGVGVLFLKFKNKKM